MPFPPLCFRRASSVLRHHPPPCQLPSISFPYTKALLASAEGWVSEGFPSSVPFCRTMSSLIPRRCHQPSVRSGLFSDSSVDDSDFAHEIEARPPHFALYEVVRLRSSDCDEFCRTNSVELPVRSRVLQPGLLRSTLSPKAFLRNRLHCRVA